MLQNGKIESISMPVVIRNARLCSDAEALAQETIVKKNGWAQLLAA